LQPTVLIAILNWGLGHATRSIPIIDAFLSNDYDVHIASDGESLNLLKKEYPNLKFYTLPEYNIKYTHKSILLNVLGSSMSILRAIFKEKTILNSIVEKIRPNIIVSDNRYGIRSKSVKSVLITHQLNIKLGSAILAKIATGFIGFLIWKFDEIWIPDYNDSASLSNELSKNKMTNKVKYIGPISRLTPLDMEKKYDIAVILSGPEPQRTKFEKKIFEQLIDIEDKVIVIRGKVDDEGAYSEKANVEVKNYLLSDEINTVINQSDIIISRSGYTTIMDLAVLGKKAIFVPTPGQTEQEYLAEYLKAKKFYYSCSQDDFELKSALERSKDYSGVKVKQKDLVYFISKV